MSDYLWVLAFDKSTGDRVGFVRCHRNNTKFYSEIYASNGYDVKIMTSDEIEKMIEQN